MFHLAQRSTARSAPDRVDVVHPVGSASVRVVASTVDDEERVGVVGGLAHTLNDLLLAVGSGDQDAFADLERHIGGLVRVNIRRVLRDAARSDAATRAFFAEVSRDASDFDPDRDSAQAWLLRRAYLRAASGLTPEPAARR